MPVLRSSAGKAINIGPPNSFAAVTPNNDTDLAVVADGLWVSAEGTVSIIAEGDVDPVSLGTLPVGTIVVGRIRRVRATGTSATVLAMRNV